MDPPSQPRVFKGVGTATHLAAGSPVEPLGGAGQHALPAHHVVDIPHQVTEDILVGPVVGETVREGEEEGRRGRQ